MTAFQGRVYRSARPHEATLHTPCAFPLSARVKRYRQWLLTGRGRLRASAGRRRRAKRSSRDELGGAESVALQTNNLGRLNPVRRRTSPPPPPPPRPLLLLPSSHAASLLLTSRPCSVDDDLAGPACSRRSRESNSTKARNRRKLLRRGHVAFSPGVIDCP